MITAPDFQKKQIVIVLSNEGDKIAFSNDNFVVKNQDGKIKFQITCYRLFIVYVIGHTSITSVLLQKARRYGFYIALLTPGFRIYGLIGAEKDGNTLLKKKQYLYEQLDIAKHITKNKINNQISTLKLVRNKSDAIKESIQLMDGYSQCIDYCGSIQEIMGYEGMASRLYFKNHFNNIAWHGRQPRIKKDITNSVLDIGYTMLFSFIDSMLLSYGFDTFCGVMHRQFYMRKSLVCDIIEPFRPIIDIQVKKSINLKQIKEEDFIIINGQYRLKYQESARYVGFLMTPIIEYKDRIFGYIQSYYRAFMKDANITNYPVFKIGE